MTISALELGLASAFILVVGSITFGALHAMLAADLDVPDLEQS